MSLPPIEQQLFRRVCGKYATGITVVTVLDGAAAPQGMTANSFTSVSLDPPLVLVCIDRRSSF
jgi:flavin reductase (DIM6/NTAB) family NADH-FMN oxidoreductase RutF